MWASANLRAHTPSSEGFLCWPLVKHKLAGMAVPSVPVVRPSAMDEAGAALNAIRPERCVRLRGSIGGWGRALALGAVVRWPGSSTASYSSTPLNYRHESDDTHSRTRRSRRDAQAPLPPRFSSTITSGDCQLTGNDFFRQARVAARAARGSTS